MAKSGLTAKQRAFCQEYLIDLNATQAAIRAGYSKKTARVVGGENLLKPAVAAEIKKAMDARAARTEITADLVLLELARIARVDVADAYLPDGSLKSIHDIPVDVRRAIAGIEVAQTNIGDDVSTATKKVKFWSKTQALDLLAKHFGLLIERHEHTHKGTVNFAHTLTDADLEAIAARGR